MILKCYATNHLKLRRAATDVDYEIYILLNIILYNIIRIFKFSMPPKKIQVDSTVRTPVLILIIM